jgi:hypothetical protein
LRRAHAGASLGRPLDPVAEGVTSREIGAKGALGDALVTVEERGQFPRLAAMCFLFSGYPSCFSNLVTYSARVQTMKYQQGAYVESPLNQHAEG